MSSVAHWLLQFLDALARFLWRHGRDILVLLSSALAQAATWLGRWR